MNPTYWTDQPILSTAQDRFDFCDYADVLSHIVMTSATPITIGIFGPWGSGKTSLMRLISNNLSGQRTLGHRSTHILWFNAWQYERDQGAIWRSLLLRVLDSLKTLDLVASDVAQIDEWEVRLYADVEHIERGSLQVDWPKLGKSALRLGLSLVQSPANLIQILTRLDEKDGFTDGLLEAVRREEIEIYRRQLQLLEEFQSGFEHLVHEYIWQYNGLLLIFIDDLDRCLPDRALEVLETIKLFLDVPGCAFFLAADHERIENVVRQRYGTPQEGVGESYLEKLVQLPFYLPPLEEAQMERFVIQAAPELSSEISRIFAQGMPPNPRMVKRMLNIFRLLETLARRRIARGKMLEIDLAQLAKMVVIQGRYRALYQDLLEYPNLIQELELRARGKEEKNDVLIIPGLDAMPPLVERYITLRPLMRVLRIGPPFTNLTPLEISSYLHLTLSTGLEPMNEIDPNQRIWDDLLSSDLTRIRAAVDLIQQRELQTEYSVPLAKLIERDQASTLRQRLSAAWALGYLGDPRNFDEAVTIPAGEFLYGRENLPYYLLSYRISRYPVTNAQYAEFIKTHRDVPIPYVGEVWARLYNWDPVRRTYPEGKANFPVVLVTWEEAQMYCEWRGGRLPTQEEWERAARGTDNRIYPWGDEFKRTCTNTRESGLGSPTPVGIFGCGKSPAGLLDCAGNVWEWTASDYNLQTKVIRGGAWNFSQDSACVFVSERSRPDHRSPAIGFRVAYTIPQPSSQQPVNAWIP